ncbi:hypothetical protein BGZ63DRAFT_437472 [Mariannaea sp. PMI_226]|nr:hypothetical protein BGZ63DRAFT_437472 [Mariannaea sp. PMI_226]
MADAEKGNEAQEAQEVQESKKASAFQKAKGIFNLRKLLIGLVLVACFLAVVFGMGIISAHYVEEKIYSGENDGPVGISSDEGLDFSNGLVRRLQVQDDEGVLVPISTQTALSTLYSISHPPEVTATDVEIVTATTYITIVDEPESTFGVDLTTEVEFVTTTTYFTVVDEPEPGPTTLVSVHTFETTSDVCSMEVLTITESVTVTLIPIPASSSLNDVTVTGNPATVTDVHTDISISSGLGDATVSGNPATVTDLRTEWSFSSSLPDATVPGNPETVTNFQASFSINSGLPDATVSGHPETATAVHTSWSIVSGSIWTVVVITDLFPQQSTPEATHTTPHLSTITQYSTVQKTITTHIASFVVVTVSGAGMASSTAAGEVITFASPFSTFTRVITETAEPSTWTTTVRVFPPPPYPITNNTMGTQPTGAATIAPIQTSPVVVVSGGSKKPEPRGWAGNGTNNLGCAIMIITAVMIFL